MTELKRIGPYELVRRLGKSMTDVYLALDSAAGRHVALKLIRLDGDPVTKLVLEAERRGAAIQKELHHVDPRMVEIYDSGDIDGYFFVAMQYFEGRNLAEVLHDDSAIDPFRAAVIALEICEQLAKFHSGVGLQACGSAVVHGDIKPSNIHISPNDTVRLLDFGIAKTLRADCNATNHNFGSPGYCSPERLSRSEVDQQSDLWAVGCTLYEMLSGVPPYQAENTRKLESLIRSKRPPRALPASCPAPLRAIVSKALAPVPAKRYSSAVEFQSDLQAFLEHRPPVAVLERKVNWSPTATLDAARAAWRKVTRGGARVNRKLRLAGAVAWFAGGMVLWIGGSYAWQLMQTRAAAAAIEVIHPPKIAIDPMPDLYIASADRILNSYLASADPWLYDFDWQKAEILLEHAVELGSANDPTLGKLALARGYAMLERLNGGQYSAEASAQLRLQALDEFVIAARKLPGDPAPRLALARVYVYSLPNLDQAISEFAAAEQLGATLGRREIEQQADAYRLRAEGELKTNLRAALEDAQTARSIYERIPAFDEVDDHLAELDNIHAPAVKRVNKRRLHRWR